MAFYNSVLKLKKLSQTDKPHNKAFGSLMLLQLIVVQPIYNHSQKTFQNSKY